MGTAVNGIVPTIVTGSEKLGQRHGAVTAVPRSYGWPSFYTCNLKNVPDVRATPHRTRVRQEHP